MKLKKGDVVLTSYPPGIGVVNRLCVMQISDISNSINLVGNIIGGEADKSHLENNQWWFNKKQIVKKINQKDLSLHLL